MTEDNFGTEIMSPPPAEPLAWHEIMLKAVTRPSEETYQQIAAQPNATTANAYIWIAIGAVIAAIISGLMSLIFGSFMMPDLGSFGAEYGIPADFPMSTGPTFLSMLCGIPVWVVAYLLGITLTTGVTHGIARLFGGKGTFEKLLFAVAAFYTPVMVVNSLISSIPFIGCLGFAIGIYALVLNVIAVKAVHKIDWGKATISTLAFPIIAFVITFCCVLIFGALMGPMIGDVFSEIIGNLNSY